MICFKGGQFSHRPVSLHQKLLSKTIKHLDLKKVKVPISGGYSTTILKSRLTLFHFQYKAARHICVKGVKKR